MRQRAKVITVFGSSRPRFGDPHYAEAQVLGGELAGKGFTVCTGGYTGVMEAVSRGAKQVGGRTLGVTAKNWRDRLFELVKRGHGYVACRGGTGTLVELAVVWELLNKGVMSNRPLVAMGDFWEPVVRRIAEVENRSWASSGKNAIHVSFAASPGDAAQYLAAHFGMGAVKGRRAGRRLAGADQKA
jgi:uncharacterized protein (TIGR00725 family)